MTKKEIPVNGPAEEKIPIRDKRRFNAEGELVADGADDGASTAASAQSQKPAAEIALEAKLKAEIERREAAEAKLVGVQAKFEEAKAAMERETAEMRERLKRTLDAQAKQGQFNFLTTLLPVLDNLNRAIEASELDPSLDHLRDGVRGTARSFEQALSTVGVEPVDSVGTDFDPELHEAVDVLAVDADQHGKVVGEYSKGYRFGDKLLRPARVQVGRAIVQTSAEN
jgi:molecular chaperone GrpE